MSILTLPTVMSRSSSWPCCVVAWTLNTYSCTAKLLSDPGCVKPVASALLVPSGLSFLTNAMLLQHLHALVLTQEGAGEVAIAKTHLFLNISSVLGVSVDGGYL